MNDRETVFLSASVPNRFPFTHPGRSDAELNQLLRSASTDRSDKTKHPRSIDDLATAARVERYRIRESVIALVGVCQELDLDLVFGGHPAITPLVHHAAQSLGYDDHVVQKQADQWNIIIYQSKQFSKHYPPEVRHFIDVKHRLFREIDAADLDRNPGESNDDFKARLRFPSIQKLRRGMIDDWTEGTYIAGVFIAGMDGVLDEFDRFRKHHDHAALFPIAATGGAVEMGWPELDMPPVQTREFDRRSLLKQIETTPNPTSPASKDLLIQHFQSPDIVTYRTLFRRLLRPLNG